MSRPAFLFFIAIGFQLVSAQVPVEIDGRIRAALAERNYPTVASELRDLESNDPVGFRENNYDYLSGRVAENNGDIARAMAAYQGVVNRNSVLKPYALWHLSRLARTSGNLIVERSYLQELISFSPDSLLLYPATRRMAQSWFESGNYDLAIRQIEQIPKRSLPSVGALGRAELKRASGISRRCISQIRKYGEGKGDLRVAHEHSFKSGTTGRFCSGRCPRPGRPGIDRTRANAPHRLRPSQTCVDISVQSRL